MGSEFREFIARGNMVDMAVGIVVGGAFATLVKSLVDDLLMPPLGLVLGGADFSDLFLLLREGSPGGPYDTLAAAREAGAVTLNLGLFVTRMVAFLIVAAALFMVVKAINALRRDPPKPPTTRPCPRCKSTIHLDATRCPQCTSELGGEPSPAAPAA
ncbi:MAG: large conductance mechanosensitive channel protein MscL [Planctomycetota bacterium]